MPFYTKKPIPIEAHQITEHNVYELAKWSDSDVVKRPDGSISGMMIYTLEGAMTSVIGDYLIKGNHNEFWFNKKEIFEQNYEEVGND